MTAAMTRTLRFSEPLMAWETGIARDLRDKCGVAATCCASLTPTLDAQGRFRAWLLFPCHALVLFGSFDFARIINPKLRLGNGDKGSFQAGEWPNITSCAGSCRTPSNHLYSSLASTKTFKRTHHPLLLPTLLRRIFLSQYRFPCSLQPWFPDTDVCLDGTIS